MDPRVSSAVGSSQYGTSTSAYPYPDPSIFCLIRRPPHFADFMAREFDILLSLNGEDSYGVSLVFARSLRRVLGLSALPSATHVSTSVTFGLSARSPMKEFREYIKN